MRMRINRAEPAEKILRVASALFIASEGIQELVTTGLVDGTFAQDLRQMEIIYKRLGRSAANMIEEGPMKEAA